MWDKSILTLDRLAARGCNRLLTTTCVLCFADEETVDHLFHACPFVIRLWNFLTSTFRLPSFPRSVQDLWERWRPKLPNSVRDVGHLISRALLWNVWLERNARIFRESFSAHSIILRKIIHMFLLWVDAVPESKKARFNEPTATAKHSLDFLIDNTRAGEDDLAK
ncbi:uncharacterized protein LOC120274393 [Dioscorea cayenensis subsp. rotundata]|uniref:Uncharacterized protein LOC120274393 n=1 Tax=Dioscorea cayennensis subsp. rotundata TaxID=55577 RepID=A0AB40CBE0_DIOCR|nr:uncharacterized protein LOC120274393 [Dioscorea cayenensis subsp. rotundata]